MKMSSRSVLSYSSDFFLSFHLLPSNSHIFCLPITILLPFIIITRRPDISILPSIVSKLQKFVEPKGEGKT
jgi:hypothetical protein